MQDLPNAKSLEKLRQKLKKNSFPFLKILNEPIFLKIQEVGSFAFTVFLRYFFLKVLKSP